MGVAGYAVGLALAVALSVRLDMRVSERVIIATVPPLSFLLAVKLSEIVFGSERIVFYEKLLFAQALSTLALWLAGGRVTLGLDLVTLGIGTFLAFGRIGCFMVGCCHGRPFRWGVRYTPEHADAGFMRRWVGRPLFPIQLVDGALSALLVVAGAVIVVGPYLAGSATVTYVCGYALGRFVLEMLRGDSVRPYWLGVSEAQWTALVTSWAAVILLPAGTVALAIACALTLAATSLMAARTMLRAAGYWLASPAHIEELHELAVRIVPGDEAQVTTLGLQLSLHLLPGGAIRDYIVSHPSRPITPTTARALARQLGWDADVRPGSTTGLVHLLVSGSGGEHTQLT